MNDPKEKSPDRFRFRNSVYVYTANSLLLLFIEEREQKKTNNNKKIAQKTCQTNTDGIQWKHTFTASTEEKKYETSENVSKYPFNDKNNENYFLR